MQGGTDDDREKKVSQKMTVSLKVRNSFREGKCELLRDCCWKP